MAELVRKNVRIIVSGAPISVARMTVNYPDDIFPIRELMPQNVSFDCELAPVRPNRRERRAQARQDRRCK